MPTTASANITYSGEHGLDQPEVNSIVTAGQEFWDHRMVAVPKPLLLTANDVGEYGDGTVTKWSGHPRCRAFSPSYGYPEVICRERFIYKTLHDIRNRYLETWFRRELFASLCTTYWHELGHVGGLALPILGTDGRWYDGHPKYGLMGEEMKRPADCYLLAIKAIERRPRHRKQETRVALPR